MKKINNNFLLIILISIFFGFLSGATGDIFIKSYLLKDQYIFPFIGDINLTSGFSGSSLTIRDAKKVVVEQEEKTEEVITNSSQSILGLFTKKLDTEKEIDINFENLYNLKNELSQVFIITSDGWALLDYEKINKLNIKNFVIIDNEKNIYEIDEFIKDEHSPFSFIHIKDISGLPIKAFSDSTELLPGKITISVRWGREAKVIFIESLIKETFIKSSDTIKEELIFNQEPLKNSVIFDLGGNVIGFTANNGQTIPGIQVKSAVNSLLNINEVKKPSLGIEYIDLSETIYKDYKNGALVVSENDIFSKGDVIKAVDNIILDKKK